MPINIRQKGAGGEREIADLLNAIAYAVHQRLGVPFSFADDGAQRNQLQTAVGGCDLTNTWGYAVEVKRQEQLAINTWWEQCLASAKRLNQEPALIFRQNGKKWRVILFAFLPLPPSVDEAPYQLGRVEIDWDTFAKLYATRIERELALRVAKQVHVDATMMQANIS